MFKVKDIVTIRGDLEIGEYYGNTYFNEDMHNFKGQKVTISSKEDIYDYNIEEDEQMWIWSKEMFVESQVNQSIKPIPTTGAEHFTYHSTKQVFTKTDKNGTTTNSFIIPERKSKMIFSNNAVICILDDKSKGVSKCCPEDSYDKTKGIKIAYIRAKIKSLQKELKELIK